MYFRNTPKLIFPLENSENISSNFGSLHAFDGEDWGMHLGIDISARAGSQVMAIGRGIVVYSAIHLGKISKEGVIKKRNWGGVIIIAHHNAKNKLNFFSIYGHLGKCLLKKGDVIDAGKVIGTIGKSMTPKNGLWEEEHLHFGIYAGPYDGKVLPGYYKKEAEITKMEYWREPISFVKDYPAV